ncbi:DHS-like NAD/FAD-binding domain-containing protein [Thozetella sp. PMI_491]|nr:DHS-like NAD/FAD-binding domain-containing protein [Thozetella sp. PMI_491]
MPTTHVTPDCESELQDIANSLWKARKVVVITGAGISTNSGIPDFRSEDGLYSLIQAQFNAAAAKEASSSKAAAAAAAASSSSGSQDACDLDPDDRPSKKRRVSQDETPSSSQDTRQEDEKPTAQQDDDSSIQLPSSDKIASETEETPRRSAPFETPQKNAPLKPREEPTQYNAEGFEHAPGPPGDDLPGTSIEVATTTLEPTTPTPNLSPLPSPGLPLEAVKHEDVDMDMSAGEVSMMEPEQMSTPRVSSRLNAHPLPNTGASSPLSSPPPILFDPYQNLSSSPPSSSDQSSNRSSRSQSEDATPASTPLLTSQSSFASSSARSSLPNLKGRDLFDSQIWSDPTATSVFYTFITTLRQKARDVDPTNSHHFLSVLRDSRKLVRCYTQNIDQLEERVGLSTSLKLGAGSRYRFSMRAGRQSGVGRTKEADTSVLSQADSQQAEEQPAGSVPGASVAPGEKAEAGSDSAEAQAEVGLPEPPASTAPPTSSQATEPPAPKRGVECVCLHGSLAELRCFLCGRTSSWDDEERELDTLAGEQPLCPHCAGATAARQERGKRALGVGRLRPDIVLYGEEHPHAHLISPIVQHDLSLNPDMLLILGTSMRVHGLKVLVREFAKSVHNKGGKVVFINFTKPAESVWADIIDYWIQSDCDFWVGDLQKRKPALWLPPGSVVEDDAPKAPKVRRNSTSQPKGKRRKSDDAVKRRESQELNAKGKGNPDGSSKQPEASSESTGSQGSTESPVEAEIVARSADEVPPPAKQASTARRAEPKLNWNAKRPAAFREHKANGAWLVCNIMSQLKRITGGDEPTSAASSPAAKPKPRAKRPRKSAPAALERADQSGDSTPMVISPSLADASGQADNKPSAVEDLVHPQGQRPMLVKEEPTELESPHFTLVGRKEIKTRAQKYDRTKPASAQEPQDQLAASSSSLQDKHGVADGSITSTVKGRKRKRTAWKMVNGVETRVTVSDNEAETVKGSKQSSKGTKDAKQAAEPRTPPPVLPQPRLAAGVQRQQVETWNQTPEPIGRNLPPLDLTRASPRSGPKIGQLEPPVTSPVERMTISARVSIPHPSTRIPNPFAIQQPLINHLEYTPWPAKSSVQPGRARAQPRARRGARKGRDEEAAMALSMLQRGA